MDEEEEEEEDEENEHLKEDFVQDEESKTNCPKFMWECDNGDCIQPFERCNNR
mgnify:CR=1 FL=1